VAAFNTDIQQAGSFTLVLFCYQGQTSVNEARAFGTHQTARTAKVAARHRNALARRLAPPIQRVVRFPRSLAHINRTHTTPGATDIYI